MTYSSATHAHSVNPATGETLAAYPWATSRDVERAIAQADTGFRQWRRESVAHRAQKLRDLGAALRSRAEEMAQTISREMASPLCRRVRRWLSPPAFATGTLNTARRCCTRNQPRSKMR